MISQRRGHQPIILAKFPQKLLEIENMWTRRGCPDASWIRK